MPETATKSAEDKPLMIASSSSLPEGVQLFGVGAEFDDVQSLYHAAEKIRDKGFRWWDVYSPFPIHGINGAMGLGKSWVSAFSLGGAITGFTTAVLLQGVTSAILYPMITQGKPYFATEAFVPIFFELTILLTAFGTLGGMLLMNGLPRWHHPAFNWDRFAKVTDDKFFIIIDAVDPYFSSESTPKLLEEIGGKHITFIADEA